MGERKDSGQREKKREETEDTRGEREVTGKTREGRREEKVEDGKNSDTLNQMEGGWEDG